MIFLGNSRDDHLGVMAISGVMILVILGVNSIYSKAIDTCNKRYADPLKLCIVEINNKWYINVMNEHVYNEFSNEQNYKNDTIISLYEDATTEKNCSSEIIAAISLIVFSLVFTTVVLFYMGFVIPFIIVISSCGMAIP